MQEVQFYRDTDLPFFELKLCDASRLCYKKHAHEEYSLGIVENGNSSFWYNGRNIMVTPRNLVFIPPNLVHSCNPQPNDRWTYKMLFVEANWLRQLLEERRLPTLTQPIVHDKLSAGSCGLFTKLFIKLTSPASPLEKEAAIMTFFAQVVRGMGTPNKENRINVLPKLVIIKEYLHDNYRRKITLNELAQIAGLNKFSIIRAFKEEFNIPPHLYQMLLRINDAKKMLRQNRQIVEVANETGFYDQSHFYKVFKSQTGVTPEKYQNRERYSLAGRTFT